MMTSKNENLSQPPKTDLSSPEKLLARIQKLEATLARERELFESLLEISATLSSTLNLPRLLDIILDATIKLTSTEASSILLIDPQTDTLYFEATSNIPYSKMERIAVPVEGSVAGWVVSHGEPRVIQSVVQEYEFTASAKVDSLTTFTTNSLLAVPLMVKGKVIGVLEAVNKRNGLPFEEEDEDILMVLAGQAAIAIENSRLFHQNDFISEMVHELRTPMLALVTLSDLISRRQLSAQKRQEIVATIQGETRRLTKMTSDFLELSRLESGRVNLKYERLNLLQIIEDVLKVQGQQAEERQIKIKVDLEDGLPNPMGDCNRIRQVLLNLVSNAIKYNRSGGTIDISARSNKESITVCVQDTGHGIPDQVVGNLFKRFYRVPDAEGYTTGTGLGLAISRRIIQQHGGIIWVESEWERGSQFYFTIPLELEEPDRSLGLE